MNIKIKTLKGDHFIVCIEQSSCFLDVKKKIQSVKHIPVEKQKLIYKSKEPQDNAILFEIGVKNDDNIVLMKLIPKPAKAKKQKSLVEESEKKKQKDASKSEQKKIEKLVKLGYRRKIAEEILKKNNYNFEKSLDQLSKKKQSSNQISINDILRKQFQRNIQGNQDYSQNNQNQIKFTGDLESLAGLLGQNNQKLQQMINDNPHVLQELLEGYGQAEAEQIEGFQGLEQQYVTDVHFTQTEQQAIQRLINLGFNREHVIPAYLACEKNEEMTANMLFNQQEQGDFDNQNN